MISKKKAIEMYKTPSGFKKYIDYTINVGLWNSEKIVFEKYVNNEANILDLGCGAGRTTFGLYKLGYKKITGLDLSNMFISFAKEYNDKNNYKINFIEGDSCNLPFDNEIFDCVFYSFNGLQLIPGLRNRQKVLSEVYRVLKKGGLFIFTAHNRDIEDFKSFWNEEQKRWENHKQNKDLEVFGDMIIDENGGKGFIHYSSIDELKKMLNDVNLKIIDYKNRSEISSENKMVEEMSSDTIFWITRKDD